MKYPKIGLVCDYCRKPLSYDKWKLLERSHSKRQQKLINIIREIEEAALEMGYYDEEGKCHREAVHRKKQAWNKLDKLLSRKWGIKR